MFATLNAGGKYIVNQSIDLKCLWFLNSHKIVYVRIKDKPINTAGIKNIFSGYSMVTSGFSSKKPNCIPKNVVIASSSPA